MRNFRSYVGVITLCWVMSAMAFVPEIDLKDAMVVAEGQCSHEEMLYKCFMLKKETVFYMIAVDAIGVIAVYTVKELKQDYEADEVKLIWSRTLKRRKDEA